MKTLQIEWLNWVVVLRPQTDLVGGPETDELCEAFNSNCAESCQGVVVDLSKVRFMNSTALGVLIQCWSEAKRTGTRTALCFPPRTLAQLKKELFFKRLPSSFETEQEAVRFCRENFGPREQGLRSAASLGRWTRR